MIRMIIFLSLALSSGVFAEVCKGSETNYTTYRGELPDGQTPESLCDCMKASLEKSGELKGRTYECFPTDGLDQFRWEDAKDDGTKPTCANCLTGCRRTVTSNAPDSDRICQIIGQSDVGRKKRAVRICCYITISWRWFLKIRVTVTCRPC